MKGNPGLLDVLVLAGLHFMEGAKTVWVGAVVDEAVVGASVLLHPDLEKGGHVHSPLSVWDVRLGVPRAHHVGQRLWGRAQVVVLPGGGLTTAAVLSPSET